MNQNTDIQHEAKRLRLLAAALELQHYTGTAANVVEIPGDDQVIVIGTPAEVAQVLAIEPSTEPPAILFDGYAVYNEVMAADPHTPRPTADNVADVLDAVVRIMRRAGQPLAEHVPNSIDSEGGHHD